MNQEDRIQAYLLKHGATTDAADLAMNCDIQEVEAQWYIDHQEVNHLLTRKYNVGQSDYAKHKIQPWDIWLEYDLNPWDADIVKRILRHKPNERRLDYEKIKHICDERIRQIDLGNNEETPRASSQQEKSPTA